MKIVKITQENKDRKDDERVITKKTKIEKIMSESPQKGHMHNQRFKKTWSKKESDKKPKSQNNKTQNPSKPKTLKIHVEPAKVSPLQTLFTC